MSWWAWLLTGLAAGASWPWWFSAYFNLEDYLYEKKHGRADNNYSVKLDGDSE